MEEYSKSDFIEEISIEEWYDGLVQIRDYLSNSTMLDYKQLNSLWISQWAEKFLSETTLKDAWKLSNLISYILENKYVTEIKVNKDEKQNWTSRIFDDVYDISPEDWKLM